MRRWAFLLVSLFVFAVVCVALLLFVQIDVSDIGNRLLAEAEATTGFRLQVGDFRLKLIEGFRLEDVQIEGEIPSGSVRGTLDAVVFKHRLWPLLRGQVAVDEIFLEGALVEIVTAADENGRPSTGDSGRRSPGPRGDSALPMPEGAPSTGSLDVKIQEIRLRDGHLEVRSEDVEGDTLVLEGLDLDLRDLEIDPQAPSALLGLSARGKIQIAAIRVGDTSLDSPSGNLSAERGVYRLSDLTASSPWGRLRIPEGQVDLAEAPFEYRITVLAEPVDLDALLGLEGDPYLGPGAVELDVSGAGIDPDGVRATGTISLAAGRIPPLSPMTDIDTILDIGLVGSAYQPTTVTLELREGAIQILPFELTGDIVKLRAEGHGELDGRATVQAQVEIPSEGLLLDANLESHPPDYELVLEGGSLDLDSALGARDQDAMGAARISARAFGPTSAPEKLQAEGTIRLDPGRFPSMPLLVALDNLLDTSSDGAAYLGTDVEFTLEQGTLEVLPFALESEIFLLRGKGSVAADGSLTFSANVGLPSTYEPTDELAADVVRALTTDDGRIWVPLIIRGTVEEPEIGLDRDALQDALKEIAKAVLGKEVDKLKSTLEDTLRDGLRSLFGNDRE